MSQLNLKSNCWSTVTEPHLLEAPNTVSNQAPLSTLQLLLNPQLEAGWDSSHCPHFSSSEKWVELWFEQQRESRADNRRVSCSRNNKPAKSPIRHSSSVLVRIPDRRFFLSPSGKYVGDDDGR